VGEMILSRNEFDPQGPLELKRVEEKFVRTAAVMELVIQGQAIKTTAEHPFYVPAQERFVPAGELQVGDQLVSSQGVLVPIESISNLNEITTVYNLRVADHHTYFVGGALWGWDVWVHNAYFGSRSTATKVGYFDSDLAEEALKYRAARAGIKLRDGRRLDHGDGNIAVFEFLDENDQLVKRAFLNRRNEDHAELWGMRVLNRAGIPRDRVTRIYSELEFCQNCEALTKASFPTAVRTYSFPYNIQRLLGKQMKAAAVREGLAQ
jgi:hypothetical protein